MTTAISLPAARASLQAALLSQYDTAQAKGKHGHAAAANVAVSLLAQRLPRLSPYLLRALLADAIKERTP